MWFRFQITAALIWKTEKLFLIKCSLEMKLDPWNYFWQILWARSSNNSILTVNVNFLYSCASIAVVALFMSYYKEDLDKKKKMPRRVDSESYLTKSVVILIRRWVCIGKHETVGYSKIVNTQICKRHPVLQKK